MEIFYENYFDGKIDIKGEMLDILEHRLDWADMHMTPELFKFVLTVLIPDVLTHSAKADETMVRDHYDRECFRILLLASDPLTRWRRFLRMVPWPANDLHFWYDQ